MKTLPKHEELLHWIKPPAGVFKINVDGSRNLEGCIGAGGVIRDCMGTWYGGFMANLGVGEVLLAEAWGLFHGLMLALRCGADHIEVESDSASLVKLVQDRMVEFHPFGTIINNCSDLMKKFRSCSLIHIFRERNRVADLLAKASLNMELGECFLEEVPVVAVEAVLDDINSVAKARVIPDQPSLHDQFGNPGSSCRQVGSTSASGVDRQSDSYGRQYGEVLCVIGGSGVADQDGSYHSEPEGDCYPSNVQTHVAGESHTFGYGQNAMMATAEDTSLPEQLTLGVHGLDADLWPHWLRQEGMMDNGTVLPRLNGDVTEARLYNQGADGQCSLPSFIVQSETKYVAEECDANKDHIV